MQLVLGALQLLVSSSIQHSGTVPSEWAVDIGAVVAAAREATDGTGRNAALALLAALARVRPGDALQHVLEVPCLSLVFTSPSQLLFFSEPNSKPLYQLSGVLT